MLCLRRFLRVAVISLLVSGVCGTLTACTYDFQESLGRRLSGLDCRPEHLDRAGRCVPAR
jgi:hypothetical protein